MKVPPSKSVTHRALICAALARGQSILINPLVCDDTLATARALEAFGVLIKKEKERWMVRGTEWKTPTRPIDCNESATTYRFLKAITEDLKISCTLTGKPSLMKRMVGNAITSQFLSGRLLAAPLSLSLRATKERLPSSRQEAIPLVSKPYVALTIDVQKKFGADLTSDEPQTYKPSTFEVEGDWSSAAFLLAAGVLHKEVVLEGLNRDSLQGDRAIATILKEMGAEIFWSDKKLVARPSSLRAIAWDFLETPDLYPIVKILSLFAKGKNVFTGTERLRFKESDRVVEMEKIVNNRKYPAHSVIDSTDHRIVMAAAVLNLARGGKMVIKNKECVAKSWPGFWEAMTTLSLPSPLEGEG